MKQISALLSAAMLVTFFACNNSDPVKEQTKTTADTTATTKPAEPPAFQPYTIVTVHHKVKDFDKWLSVYQADDSARKANGLTEIGIGRGLDNNNEITVAFKADDIQKAKDFTKSPGLKTAMQKAGVTGPPTISYLTVIRDDNSNIEQKERLMVAHHVKDFDAWLKVYDSEGKATRAANGLIDRGLARGVDDPNTVYVLFAVTDIGKAKARANSPELKKLMTDAGVDGPPTINFYKLTK
ncbi:MAG: hypothetical protein HYR66_17600 [Sphingobacteriales bacterium]|nr:hypothetical protein [Sphingobacteriales bacterium]MBI3717145.1 hypothetical protein [Sphingobacteriales bacterium]